MTSIVAKIRARELGKNQTTSNFLVWFLNNITVSGTDLYKEQIYRVRDLLCYILELKFGFCMHLKDVTLKIVHELRNKNVLDKWLITRHSHGNNTCIWNGSLHETFYSKRFVYPNAFFWNGENIGNGTMGQLGYFRRRLFVHLLTN